MTEQQTPYGADYRRLAEERWARRAEHCPGRVEIKNEIWCIMTTRKCDMGGCIPQHWDPA